MHRQHCLEAPPQTKYHIQVKHILSIKWNTQLRRKPTNQKKTKHTRVPATKSLLVFSGRSEINHVVVSTFRFFGGRIRTPLPLALVTPAAPLAVLRRVVRIAQALYFSW